MLGPATALILLALAQAAGTDASAEPAAVPKVSPSATAADARPGATSVPAPDPVSTERATLVLELDAYYTDLGVEFSLTDEPIPKLGERSELELYLALLPRVFTPRELVPRFMVLEASVNPMPCLGALVRARWPGFYDDASLSSRFNWIRSATAGFEEPYALSVFAGNVADYDVPGRPDITGKGYGGLLVSMGFHHIKDNRIYQDTWVELESKVKGDRRSPVKKLSWSFRAGLKFHSSRYIADVAYFALRRARLDYADDAPPFLANSGFEYRFDVALRGLAPARHTLLLDKKWLVGRGVALSLAAGFVWELREAYSGVLASRDHTEFQWVVRPNVEF